MTAKRPVEAARIGAFGVFVYRHTGGSPSRPWGWSLTERRAGRDWPTVLCDYRYRTKREATIYGLMWAGKMSGGRIAP